ncbi:fumarylacetoacetate hydrolase family protein [Sneathiella sp. P13V-1]|uniref:fumarylacetoacetate hydrolase family protein n=1 Tax=Sneathiella sp. P13V-1 TaxID=2697366 RepID=UPI00187B5E93|nr:fumarylacetoacetate hydrolase family protein [Sneathiella sp. P13V-1]MBE7635290.1 fumarylacetoacetate hydrolase family protein [Sneathiella sp. P13V-1]
MKFVTYSFQGGGDRLGALLSNDKILDLKAVAGDRHSVFDSMLSLIEGGQEALDFARKLLREADHGDAMLLQNVRLRAPIPRPPQIRDFMAFEKHAVKSLLSALKIRSAASEDPAQYIKDHQNLEDFKVPPVWYEKPIYYKGNRFAITDPEKEITWPSYSKVMDYELELACVIGKKGKNISKENARDHIFGFTIFNDLSARDVQGKEMGGRFGPAKSKDFDDASPMGPCLVTLDEIEDPYDLQMVARINGEERSRGNSGSIHWTFEEMIEYVSRDETLYPGEILGSGTIGNGCGLELLNFLQDGDVVELEIEKIGTLRNRIKK